LHSYEQISRFKKIPLLGQAVFAIMDTFQKIQPFYPFRDLSAPTVQQKYFYKFIRKGLGRDLIQKLNPSGLPFVTTFFVAAYMAEYHNYQGDIYCLICDTDASRAWAPLDPPNSRIKFLLPSDKAKTRFLMYGVPKENLIVTGFPLPQENIGSQKKILLADLSRRIISLDPSNIYRTHEKALLKSITPKSLDHKKIEPVTITFAVGGAGAQKEIGSLIISRLKSLIKIGEIKINLVAGNRSEVRAYFENEIRQNNLRLGRGVEIVFDADKMEYFKKFNQCLHQTDILWTKPSELSFYCALGLPIIMSAPVGSQEDFNREWLLNVGAGIDSFDPNFVDEWLPDLLASGRLARAAMDGFLQAESSGTDHIMQIFNAK